MLEVTEFLLQRGIIQILFFLIVSLGFFAPVLVWAERRQSAMIQDRIGPIRAGPSVSFVTRWPGGAALLKVFEKIGICHAGRLTMFGLLHPLADAIKFIWKEDFVPPRADKLLHALAPIIAVVPAIVAFAVIPFAAPIHLDRLWDPVTEAPSGPGIPMQVASLNVGILFVFAVASTGVIGAAIAGYSSDNKYSLLGGLRAAGQMVSYEVTLGLTLVGCFMVYASLRLEDAVAWQMNNDFFGWLPAWGIFVQPLAFILFFTASVAETKRIPFDVPEGESELVGGYFTEYSGMKFGMFFTGEFIEVVVLAALLTTLFLGGYHMPGLHPSGIVIGELVQWDLPHLVVIVLQAVVFLVKVAGLIWFQLMIRWTLPRFRYDQIMKLCWRYLLPLSLLNILITGFVILWRQ